MSSRQVQRNGVKFEKDVLERADRAEMESPFKVTVDVAKELLGLAMDGGRITPTEKRTLEEVAARPKTTAAARAWLEQAMETQLQKQEERRKARDAKKAKASADASQSPSIPDSLAELAPRPDATDLAASTAKDQQVMGKQATALSRPSLVQASSGLACAYDAELVKMAEELSQCGSITKDSVSELSELVLAKNTLVARLTLRYIITNFPLTGEAKAVLMKAANGEPVAPTQIATMTASARDRSRSARATRPPPRKRSAATAPGNDNPIEAAADASSSTNVAEALQRVTSNRMDRAPTLESSLDVPDRASMERSVTRRSLSTRSSLTSELDPGEEQAPRACHNCGNALRNDVAFCSKCGTKVEGRSVASRGLSRQSLFASEPDEDFRDEGPNMPCMGALAASASCATLPLPSDSSVLLLKRSSASRELSAETLVAPAVVESPLQETDASSVDTLDSTSQTPAHRQKRKREEEEMETPIKSKALRSETVSSATEAMVPYKDSVEDAPAPQSFVRSIFSNLLSFSWRGSTATREPAASTSVVALPTDPEGSGSRGGGGSSSSSSSIGGSGGSGNSRVGDPKASSATERDVELAYKAGIEVGKLQEKDPVKYILGGESKEEQWENYRRIMRLVHPDKGHVPSDDPRGKLTLAMVQAAAQSLRGK